MRALGVVGWSGAGKTTLLTGVLPYLVAGGVRVATIKHAHHGFDLDRPGKDSHRHREAGAGEVLLAGGARWALLHEGAPPPLAVLLRRMAPVDLVLIEGFRRESLPKIEVFRVALGQPPQWPGRADIVAVATEHFGAEPVAGIGVDDRALLPLSDHQAIAAWIHDWLAAWDHGARRGPAARVGVAAHTPP